MAGRRPLSKDCQTSFPRHPACGPCQGPLAPVLGAHWAQEPRQVPHARPLGWRVRLGLGCVHEVAGRRKGPTSASASPGQSELTVDALKLHNELQSGSLHLGPKEGAEMAVDGGEEAVTLASSERTSGTFLSGLTDCTNLTFSKVQRFWESNSAAHKEVGPAEFSPFLSRTLT